MEEVLEHVKRLQSHAGVQGVLMAKADGAVVYTTMKEDDSIRYATFARNVLENTSSELEILQGSTLGGDLALIRIRTMKNELMIAKEKGFLMVAVQSAPAH